MRGFRATTLAAMLIGALTAIACASSVHRSPVQTSPSPIAHLRSGARPRIAVIVMENAEYGDIVGSSEAPYINRLAREYALAGAMYATSHPSLPNYLALTGGSTFGISSDCTTCAVKAAGIVDQLERAHVSWKAYMEDLPRPCFSGSGAGGYAKRHNPFAYYRDVTGDPGRCGKIVPLGRLAGDERRGRLARFSWITPNLCHDMHDCSTATGDRFLSRLVPPLLHALGRDGLLVLTWDEGTTDAGCCRLGSGGHIATILAGGAARRAVRLGTAVDQYSTLQTIEDLLGLPRLRGARCACTPSLQPLLATTR